MGIVSFLLASLHENGVPVIFEEMRDHLSRDIAEASFLAKWFRERIGLNSTVVCNVSIANLGKSPVLFSGRGWLEIPMPSGEIRRLECHSEDYTEGSQEDKSVSMTVKVLSHISELLDIGIPVPPSPYHIGKAL